MSRVTEAFRSAIQHQQAKNFARAEAEYREILRVDPGHAGAHCNLAGILAQQKRNPEVVACCVEFVRANPNSADGWVQLGDALAASNQLSDAILCYRDALKINPKSAFAYNNLGNALAQIGEADAAFACFQQAVVLNPLYADAQKNLGKVLIQLGQLDAAVEALSLASRLHPGAADIHCQLAAALHALGRADEAVDCLRCALEIAPESAAAYFGLANVYLSQKRLQESRAAYEAGLRHDPEHAPAWKNLGCILDALGQPSDALDCFDNALDADPNFIEALYNRGNVLAAQKRFDEAAASYRQAIAIESQYGDAHNNLGTVLLRQDKFDEAAACFRVGLEINPRDPNAAANLAHTLKHHKRLDEAIDAYRIAAELNPQNVKLCCLLGNLCKDQRRYDEAVDAYRRAIVIDPDCVAAHYELGNTFKHVGRLDEARRCYEQVLRLKPDDPATLICLGNVLKTQDHLDEAAASYRKVLKLLPAEPAWELWTATLCPAVFESNIEIDRYRAQLLRDIERVSHMSSRLKPEQINACGCPPPYNLQFHGRDDRPLKEAYANLFNYLSEGPPPAAPIGHPKVGFLVTDAHEGVFIRYMRRVLEKIDRALFEPVIFCSVGGAKRIRSEMGEKAPRIEVTPSRFDQIVEMVRAERLDVVYYWEIGSDAVNYFLPFVRLAPVQCTSAGVLDTSGISQVDYFISSELVEIEAADRHYTEKLIRAHTFLSDHDRLALPAKPKSRDEFGFCARQHLYVCNHKIRKFHPDYDAILAGILQSDGEGLVVIPEDENGHFAAKLRQRLELTMGDVFDRVRFVPYQTIPGYLSLVAAADVLLDPIYYGGGLTAYDGFALNQPTVTLPTEFARGRYTYAFLKSMSLLDIVASTPREYVDIAVELGTDRELRDDVRRRLRESSPLLFNDGTITREYDKIFERMIVEARK